MTPKITKRVAYEGEIFTKKDIEALWKHLLRYRAWALLSIED